MRVSGRRLFTHPEGLIQRILAVQSPLLKQTGPQDTSMQEIPVNQFMNIKTPTNMKTPTNKIFKAPCGKGMKQLVCQVFEATHLIKYPLWLLLMSKKMVAELFAENAAFRAGWPSVVSLLS